MEVLLNFLLKSGIGLLTLYLFYYALLRNETNFRFNRLYLLLSPLVALTLPLIKWPALLSPDTDVVKTLQAFQLSEVTVVAYNQQGDGVIQYLTTVNILWSIYLLVVLFLTTRFCRQLWHIRSLRTRATTIERTPEAVQILQLREHSSSFAFLHYIFLSDQQLSPLEKQQVLAHELAHVQLRHTYDILFYEVLSIALWFNPVIWLLKKELGNLHEFQADTRVLEQHQLQEYSTLLSKEVLFNMGLPIGSHFQKPQVLQRLHMLKQHGRQDGWLKPLLTLPLLAMLLLTLTSQQTAADLASQLTSPAQATATSSDTVGPKDNTNQPPLKADARRVPPALVQTGKMPILKGDTSANMPFKRSEPANEMPNSYKDKPYTYVEQMPQFKGGESEMLKYLGTNIRYPKDAQEANVAGMVVISFVIAEDGRLHDVKVLKSVSESIDAEAVRVVKQTKGKWVPGRQNGKAVPVRYTLPIRFAIK